MAKKSAPRYFEKVEGGEKEEARKPKRTFPKKGSAKPDDSADGKKLSPRKTVSAEEEKRLEARLFGKKWTEESSDDESGEEEGQQGEEVEVERVTEKRSAAAWNDEDEVSETVLLPRKKTKVLIKKSTDTGEEINAKDYASRLRQAFQRTHNAGKAPAWAITKNQRQNKAAEKEEDVDSDDEVAQAIGEMTRSVGRYVEKDEFLPRGLISTSRVPDITIGRHSTRSVNVVRFHRTRPVVITATEQGLIQLFKVSENAREDHFLQNVELKKFAIRRMEITSNGTAVLCGSFATEYLMKYDMESAKVMQIRMPASIPRQGVGRFALSSDNKLIAIAARDSQIHILAANSMEHVRQLVAPGKVVDANFFPGGSNELWAITENGNVMVADTRNGKSWLHTFVDEGSVHGTALSISRQGDYLATASDTGFVNVYDPSQARTNDNPKPMMAFDNLTTSCQAIAFNSDSQLLAMASHVKQNQLRLAHIGSQSVYPNFPQQHEKVTDVQSLDFSPNSGYLGVGCRDGNILEGTSSGKGSEFLEIQIAFVDFAGREVVEWRKRVEVGDLTTETGLKQHVDALIVTEIYLQRECLSIGCLNEFDSAESTDS
ncbi:hypothetical protein WR25_18842 [Diploscapter pachys]|uniref:Anaphase-promoting complex subunit 4 WD40 domain-containing protein n=1 Tax=Diploscapter pachys TaxID=2018661 RepID=A0A2A2KI92_9BILA|nr:hypothetical protein WR25_18842 [Diploscapter pachys]